MEQCVDKKQKNNRETENEKRLIYWQFESELKQCYRLFLEGLEVKILICVFNFVFQSLAGNMVEGVAENACREICELLMERPEQEQFLLSALINRLGHPQSRVAAKVAQMLEQLVQRHPNMRSVVVKEVEQLMFRYTFDENDSHILVLGKTYHRRHNAMDSISSVVFSWTLVNLNWHCSWCKSTYVYFASWLPKRC